jgi:uncharacterized protein (TIGR02145 family)
MKKIITIISLFVTAFVFSQVGIGTTSPDSCAALDVTSTTKGLLTPRMTYIQKTAIVAPKAGLVIWCTNCSTNGEMQLYNGVTWKTLESSSAHGIISGPPTNPIATAIGNLQANIAFTAPAYTGSSAITGYTVTSSPGGLIGSGTISPIPVNGLIYETSYTFIVVATNAEGNSVASSSSNTITPFTVPGVPTNPIATVGNTQASVAFTSPVFNGGSIITGYTVTSIPGGLIGTGTSSPIVVNGLTNGTSYTFSVIATNAAGNSSASSASSAIIPFNVPDAPTSPIATPSSTQVSVAFTPPVSNGGRAITGYTVTTFPGNITTTGTSSPIIVSGLINGNSYTFSVVASNIAGSSIASTSSVAVTPSTVPSSPINLIATAVGNLQISIAFTIPVFNGGSAITNYILTSSPYGFTGSGIASPINVTGLTNGIFYTFTAVASNINGNSLASTSSNSIKPITVPGAPTSPIATFGNAQASVAFTPPGDRGGSTVTGYTVTSTPGGLIGSGSSSPIVVTGLSNGTSYTFTVIATNAAGNSVASVASNAVIPYTVPSAPTSANATLGNAQASVTFSFPTSNGGNTITGYTITSSPGNITASGATSPIVIAGLTNGTSYSFTVKATNAAGSSVASAVSNAVIPYTVPDAPTSPIATTGNSQASIAFSPPTSNGGSPITRYIVTASPGGSTGSGTSSPIVVTGLIYGTSYTFSVVAINLAGNSLASVSSAPISTYTIPGIPTDPVVSMGITQASVAFTAPSSNGGTSITGYTVTASPGGFIGTGVTSPIVVMGLTTGTSYTFTVLATNPAGNSAASSPSIAAVTYGLSGNAICNETRHTDIVEITSSTGKKWMDRNIGATRAATSETDYMAYGCLYQWGRGKDRHASIIWSSASTGTPVNGSTTTLATSDTPGDALFITVADFVNFWDWRSDKNGNRWQAGSQINNPCSKGFHVPTNAELSAEMSANTISNSATAFSSIFKFVVPGSRNKADAQLYETGTASYYWSSTVVFGLNAYVYSLNSSAISNNYYYRSYGFSVRCIKD